MLSGTKYIDMVDGIRSSGNKSAKGYVAHALSYSLVKQSRFRVRRSELAFQAL